jgi:hypothetical protein
MAVIISNLNDIPDAEVAYGRNIVSLFNASGGSNRMVLQVVRGSDNTVIADLRQLPNAGSYAHFDIQRVLQAQVSQTPNPESLSPSVKYFTNPDECFDYYFKVGTVNSSGIVTIDATYSGSVVEDYLVIPGRKQVNTTGETAWQDYGDYAPQLGTFPGAPNNDVVPEIKGFALTQQPTTPIAYQDITDGKPSAADFPVPTELIYQIDVYRDQDHSLQWLQRWVDGALGGGAPAYYNGINYMRFVSFNGNTQLNDSQEQNIQSQGGGPNITFNSQNPPTGQYGIIGYKTGRNNPSVAPATTHYYVWPASQKNDAFVQNESTRTYHCYRINIIEPECNDYDVIQVKWLNSVGGTDFFTFQKKNEEKINVKRNTYETTNQDWAGSSWTEYPYDRGKTVFNQEATTVYTANTRYLSDTENEWLKNLYLSPDVKVKFGLGNASATGGWQSVVLTSNTFTEKTFRKDKLFQQTITFEMANKLNLQGG